MKKELLNLPEPKEPVVVAVYKFRDQTGQYKETNVGASWSTAVTQGATNILIRALEESKWFVPIERENISNLLNERKIIRSSREQYEGTNNVLLPPLLFAGVLLEGGIISYETNIFTGGAGVRYFGSDASSQYREDRVSIYLRAVSTSNGKVLKTVYTTKSILSQEVSAGFFRYVKFRRLLEAETGYTYNEPTEMAITEAVEKAVHSLVLEGVMGNLWELKEDSDTTKQLIDHYLTEKSDNVETDYIGRLHRFNHRSSFYVSPKFTTQSYIGDYSSSTPQTGFAASFGFGLSNSLYIDNELGYQQVNISDVVNSREFFGTTGIKYLANPSGKLSPYARVGAGTYYNFGNNIALSNQTWFPLVNYTAGLEYVFGNKTAMMGEAYVNQHLSDTYDGVSAGSFNDLILGFKFGIKMYIGN
ncbi:CsgG/HfaB family protein [Litoribacter populi]|uniref:CsgG/HfaB family protein n=1 Tax=Litoribacter populi TaxID=2598460 RepID=UPI001F36B6DD|nr:CsgG/HfaB family protein [Litoribacter populi]